MFRNKHHLRFAILKISMVFRCVSKLEQPKVGNVHWHVIADPWILPGNDFALHIQTFISFLRAPHKAGNLSMRLADKNHTGFIEHFF